MSSMLTKACAAIKNRINLAQGVTLLALAVLCLGAAMIHTQINRAESEPADGATAGRQLWNERLAIVERQKQDRQALATTRPDQIPPWSEFEEAELTAIRARATAAKRDGLSRE